MKTKEYWKGFNDGQKSSLKHNIILMKLQLKGVPTKEIKSIRKAINNLRKLK